MFRAVVASRNPVKSAAVLGALERMRNVLPDLTEGTELVLETVSVPSGVADQPMTDAETRAGARNRALAAERAVPDADAWFGVEGGVEEGDDGELWAFAWIAVRRKGRLGEARSAAFLLPPEVAALVRGGMEMGEADDSVFGCTDSKRGASAAGLLTGGVIDRRRLYEEAVVFALIPSARPELYPPPHPTPG